MSKRKLSLLAFTFAAICSFIVFSAINADELNPPVSFYPPEIDSVLNNPYMGLSVSAASTNSKQPHRLVHANMTWREIEPEPEQFAFEAFEKKNNLELWKQRDVKVVLRLVLDYPREQEHMDIPDWLYQEIGGDGYRYERNSDKGFSPNYANPVLIEHHRRLLKALGERYNPHPQIAAIQLGSIGHWVEWHTSSSVQARIPFPKHEITDQYAKHYVDSFPSKQLLMRRPHQVALDHGMGLYNDAFGEHDATVDGFLRWYTEGYTSWLTKDEEPAMPRFWESAPSAGEFSHPTKHLEDERIEATLKQAKLTHVSWMGPQGPAREPAGGELQGNIDRFLKTIGYRFIIVKESHVRKTKAGTPLHITMLVHNRGAAPFYHDWPLELSLIDAAGNIAAAAKTTVDIRKWLPGEAEASADLPIPPDIAPGSYTVHAAILDPDTGKPGIELAIAGKRPDLRYALGTVEVTE